MGRAILARPNVPSHTSGTSSRRPKSSWLCSSTRTIDFLDNDPEEEAANELHRVGILAM